MDAVELRGLRPRQHPLLAVAAQMNVGLDVIGVAQMVSEADERVGEIIAEALGRAARGRRTAEDGIDGGAPLLDESDELIVDKLGNRGPRGEAFGRAAVRIVEQRNEKRLDPAERPAYRGDLFCAGLER